jgi:hypothetical protein
MSDQQCICHINQHCSAFQTGGESTEGQESWLVAAIRIRMSGGRKTGQFKRQTRQQSETRYSQ